MSNEYVTYKAPNTNRLTIEKSMELQRMILDFDSMEYYTRPTKNDEIISRSAGTTSTTEEKKQRLTVQQMLEIQDRILNNP